MKDSNINDVIAEMRLDPSLDMDSVEQKIKSGIEYEVDLDKCLNPATQTKFPQIELFGRGNGLKRRWANRIAREWDTRLVMRPCVADWEPLVGYEQYGVIDGNHRIYGAQANGLKSLAVLVYMDLTIPEQAGLFTALNRDRTTVSQIDQFHSDIVYGDPNALGVKEMLDKYGITVGGNVTRGNHLSAIKMLRDMYDRSPDIIDATLELMTDVWNSPTYTGTFQSVSIASIFSVLGSIRLKVRKDPTYKRIDMLRMKMVLARMTPVTFSNLIHAKTGASTVPDRYQGRMFNRYGVDVILDAYNERLSKRNRILHDELPGFSVRDL
tara:strand:+ start:28 stop:999 length:972 start_codon:yes stop_codon:yes gene_type:complete